MSYTFYSFRSTENHNVMQWEHRTVEEETRSCENRTLVDIFRRFIHPNSQILEAGCGLGGWVNYFHQKGYHIIGIEYEKDIIKEAKEFDASLPIMYGDVRSLDFPEDSFDAYISLGVIEHFYEGPQKALCEAYRVLKPGGLVFISVPYLSVFRKICVQPLRNLYFAMRRLRGKPAYFWEYRYTKVELTQFLEDAGFEVIFAGVDDYIPSDRKHHIGLYADFFFLRARRGGIWELNFAGKILLSLLRQLSPWLFCSGVLVVGKNTK